MAECTCGGCEERIARSRFIIPDTNILVFTTENIYAGLNYVVDECRKGKGHTVPETVKASVRAFISIDTATNTILHIEGQHTCCLFSLNKFFNNLISKDKFASTCACADSDTKAHMHMLLDNASKL